MSHSKTVKGDLQSATKFNVASTYKFSLDLNKVKKTNQLLSEKLQKHQQSQRYLKQKKNSGSALSNSRLGLTTDRKLV